MQIVEKDMLRIFLPIKVLLSTAISSDYASNSQRRKLFLPLFLDLKRAFCFVFYLIY